MILLEQDAFYDLAREIVRNNFYSAMALRFTLVFFILLLVKFLVALLRYNLKMKSFYDSRAIAISLSGTDDLDRVKGFAEVYATDKIDLVVDDLGSSSLTDMLKSLFGK